MAELRYLDLKTGDHAPWFHQRCTSNERYAFDTVGGRYVLMCFYGAAAAPWTPGRLDWIAQHRAAFDDVRLSLFGVSVDARDELERRTTEALPGIRQIWDRDGSVSRLFGGLPMTPRGDMEAAEAALPELVEGRFRPRWLLLDPTLQIRACLPFRGMRDELPDLQALLESLPPMNRASGVEMDAPVIVVPGVFEPTLCRALVERYEAHGGEVSGFMREEGGMTVGRHDRRHKVRRDFMLEDPELMAHIQRRVVGRLVPMVKRAFQFDATRMERYLVACYDAAEGAHFRAHRDNTTRGTAHRRFAVTINLVDGFEGGTLSFPEFGARSYKPPAGAALVFSCSLLHQVDVVTSGRRFAFLPFLYDDAAAAQRESNTPFVANDAPSPA